MFIGVYTDILRKLEYHVFKHGRVRILNSGVRQIQGIRVLCNVFISCLPHRAVAYSIYKLLDLVIICSHGQQTPFQIQQKLSKI